MFKNAHFLVSGQNHTHTHTHTHTLRCGWKQSPLPKVRCDSVIGSTAPNDSFFAGGGGQFKVRGTPPKRPGEYLRFVVWMIWARV